MVAERLDQEAHVLIVKATDLKVDCVSLVRALDRFLVVLADALQVLKKIDLDEAWFVLVPCVILDRHELHV